MTRRLALAIALTAWAVLAVGGAAAYLAVRAALVEELDRSLVARATAVRGDGGGAAGGRYVVRGASGRTIARPPADADMRPEAEVVARRFATLGDGTRVRSLTLRLPGDPPETIVYSGPARELDRTLRRVAITLATVGLAAGVASAGVAVVVARRALRPLRDTARALGTIDEAALDRRVDAAGLPPELRPTVETLNGMLARLEAGFAQRRRFLADAAHELRTPVAGLMATLEIALRRPRDNNAYRETIGRALDDARYLRRLVETLLGHARGELAAAQVRPVPCDAAEVLARSADAVAGATPTVAIDRDWPASLPMTIDPDRLRGIATALLENAVRHAAGRVVLSARREGDVVAVRVSDDGPGIAAADLPRVFEPFFRNGGDGAAGGLGLGLFLVQSHARALGGTCDAISPPGEGATFTVRLPAVESGGAGRDNQERVT